MKKHLHISITCCAVLFFVTSCTKQPGPQAFTVGEPEVVYSIEEMRADSIKWMDTSIYGFKENGQWKWFAGEGRAGQTIGIGPKERPFDSIFMKELFVQGIPDSHRDSVPWREIRNWANSHWISNIYLDRETGHILAFLHLEYQYTYPGHSMYNRTGLAISKDGGRTFSWCGYILSPELTDETWINHWYPRRKSCNGGLSNYIVKDGYFYVYYTDYYEKMLPAEDGSDRGLAVARARVEDVIAGARDTTVVEWMKYFEGGWTEKGCGGKFTALNIEPHGTMHGDIAYNSHLGMWVVVTRRYSDSAIVISSRRTV